MTLLEGPLRFFELESARINSQKIPDWEKTDQETKRDRLTGTGL
jgi:hypothetical protein